MVKTKFKLLKKFSSTINFGDQLYTPDKYWTTQITHMKDVQGDRDILQRISNILLWPHFDENGET